MSQAQQPIRYQQHSSGQWQSVDGGVIVEAPVSLTVNGQVWLSFMCTPIDLEALAVGFLFNEGVLQKRNEIVSVRVCPTGDNVDVWLSHSAEEPRSWRRTSGCTGGVTAAEPIAVVSPHHNGITLTPDQIGRLMEQMMSSQGLYNQVGGVHTSVLSDGQCPRIVAEDIGRHNTLDKIAGRYLLDELEFSHKVLMTTGRISSEMLQKAMRIGAPVVLSRTSPSSLSVEMARKAGITLIGYARRGQFNVYSHPERILSEAITGKLGATQRDISQ
ncbi:MAG: formate dehydrogenase accessory sulfurtransferase FdhD [Anaerolineae bacterium]|nr:formate dehydrogenase accessory sulfurtransferase FdhD [Anaerolineae bacterium]